MNASTIHGIAIGIGLGWLNATLLGIPGWANILMMGAFALLAEMSRQMYRGGYHA